MIALLIIGGGPAGFAAARAYRACEGAGEVVIVAEEQRMPYQRPPLTKELFAARWRRADWASNLIRRCAARCGLADGRTMQFNTSETEVALSGRSAIEYATCLLATGAEPVGCRFPCGRRGVPVYGSLDELRE